MDILARRLLAEAASDDPIHADFANDLASAFYLPVKDITVTVSVLLPGTSVMMDVGDLALVGSVKSLNFYTRQGSVTGLALSQGFAQAEWAAEQQVSKPAKPLDWFSHHRGSETLTLFSVAIPQPQPVNGRSSSVGVLSLGCSGNGFEAERHVPVLNQLAQALAWILPGSLPGFYDMADIFLGILCPPAGTSAGPAPCRSHAPGPGPAGPGLEGVQPQMNAPAPQMPRVETRTGSVPRQSPAPLPEPALEPSPAIDPNHGKFETPPFTGGVEDEKKKMSPPTAFRSDEADEKPHKKGLKGKSMTSGGFTRNEHVYVADEKPKRNVTQDPMWLTFLDRCLEAQFRQYYAASQCENDALSLLVWMGAYWLALSMRTSEVALNLVTRLMLGALIFCARGAMVKTDWYMNNRTLIILAIAAGHNLVRIVDACWWINEWAPHMPPPLAWQISPLLLTVLVGIALDSLGLQLPFVISAWSRPILALIRLARAIAEGTLLGAHSGHPLLLATAVTTILAITLAPVFVSRWCERRAREAFLTAAVY